jgi:hypothetical protein
LAPNFYGQVILLSQLPKQLELLELLCTIVHSSVYWDFDWCHLLFLWINLRGGIGIYNLFLWEFVSSYLFRFFYSL